MPTNECDPNKVYPDSVPRFWVSIVTSAINFSLALVVLLCSPFIIYLPFTRTKLNNTCRKIISMIVLSDLISTFANLELLVGNHWNQASDFIVPCILATMTLAITQWFSLFW